MREADASMNDHDALSRRRLLQRSALAITALAAGPSMLASAAMGEAEPDGKDETSSRKMSPRATGAPADAPSMLYRISLAEWSLHRSIHGAKFDHLEFAGIARNAFDLDAVEYVNGFFKDKATDQAYLKEMKQRADDHGVRSLLIMCDGEGRLGDPDAAAREQAARNHHKWVEAAKFLGCHSIRVNAHSEGTPEEQRKLVADGLRMLTEYAAERDLNVIVENHGGLSSNGGWLKSVMEAVDHPRCGTLPDFGNFHLGNGEWYDRYQGVKEMMPFAKAVSAKSHEFNDDGDEVRTDFHKMMRIVLDAGYRGYIGIEWEGGGIDEMDGVRKTKDLLVKVRKDLAPEYAKDRQTG